MLEIEYIIGLVMGIIQIAKRWVPSEYLPFLAVVLGAALNVANAAYFGGDVREAVKGGVVAAGLAVGIFSGVKNSIQRKDINSL